MAAAPAAFSYIYGKRDKLCRIYIQIALVFPQKASDIGGEKWTNKKNIPESPIIKGF
jgi:hypothetical protein